MILQAAIDQVLPELRAEADARMASRVRVMRRAGTTTDPDGYEVPSWTLVHSSLPFRLGSGSNGDGGSKGVSIGGVTFEDATAVGHMPAGTRDLADDDLIEIVSGEWAGSVFRIVAAVGYDQKTARRVPIVENVRPGEWT